MTDKGVDPDKKVAGTHINVCMHLHEYQTSKAAAIIESDLGRLRCFSLSLYSFSSFTFCPTFFKTRFLSLGAGVSRVRFTVHHYMFDGRAKTVII